MSVKAGGAHASGSGQLRSTHAGMGGQTRSAHARESGQATVELAVVLPVALVVAFIVIMLGVFMVHVARFERIAADTALALSVAPAGAQTPEQAQTQIKSQIEAALKSSHTRVEVAVERMDLASGGLLALAPGRVRVACTLIFRPLARGFTLAGVNLGGPLELRHTTRVVVDAGAVGFNA